MIRIITNQHFSKFHWNFNQFKVTTNTKILLDRHNYNYNYNSLSIDHSHETDLNFSHLAETSWNFIRILTREQTTRATTTTTATNRETPGRPAFSTCPTYFYDPLPPLPASPTIIILRGSPRLLSESRTSAQWNQIVPPPLLPPRVACGDDAAHPGIQGVDSVGLPAIPPRASVHHRPGRAHGLQSGYWQPRSRWFAPVSRIKRRSHRWSWSLRFGVGGMKKLARILRVKLWRVFFFFFRIELWISMYFCNCV